MKTPGIVVGYRFPDAQTEAARAELEKIIIQVWAEIVFAIGSGSNPRQTFEMGMRRAANHAHVEALKLARAKPKAKR